MNASFMANFIPADLWKRKDNFQSTDSFAIDRANAITANLAKILDRVDPSQYSEVIELLNDYPESETQLNLLLSAVSNLADEFSLAAEEIVVGVNGDGERVLDLYIRIAEKFDDFETAKMLLRDRYNRSQSIGKRHVFPVVLRRFMSV